MRKFNFKEGWVIVGNTIKEKKKIPFVPAWKTFSKLPEEEKEKLFNVMRAEIISHDLMEKK